MSKKFFIIFVFTFSLCAHLTNAQKKNQKSIDIAGPVIPFNPAYPDYKTYSLKVNTSPEFEAEIKEHKISFTPLAFAKSLGFDGLKSDPSGDYRIEYNITRFEIIDYKTIERAPAVVLGLELNLKIMDKEDKLIFSRYLTPRANTYIFPYANGNTALNVLKRQYKDWMDEFSISFLFNPVLKDVPYYELSKLPKESELEKFNLSVQVFPALLNTPRAEWSTLFAESQKYWTTLLEYTDQKDEEATREVRLVAAYNLSVSNLVQGNIPESVEYQARGKENEKKVLGTYYYNYLISVQLKAIKEFQAIRAATEKRNAIQEEPELTEIQKNKDSFRYLILRGEVTDNKGEKFKGEIKITNDNPAIIDYRVASTVPVTLEAIFSLLKTDNNLAYITIPGIEKPVKRRLDDLISITTDDNKKYLIGYVGTLMGGNMRYSLLEEVNSHKDISVYKEFFPQSSLTFKKASEKNFFEIDGLVPRASLIKFFESCPAMQKVIEEGPYNNGSKENYIKLFEEYTKLCK